MCPYRYLTVWCGSLMCKTWIKIHALNQKRKIRRKVIGVLQIKILFSSSIPSLKIWYNGLAFKVYSNYVPVLQPCYFFFKFMKPNVLHFILFKLTAYLTEITVDNPPM